MVFGPRRVILQVKILFYPPALFTRTKYWYIIKGEKMKYYENCIM